MEESYGWLFVGSIPLLFGKKRVAKQLQIEAWLDLIQLVKELNIQKIERKISKAFPINYVV